MISQHYEGLLYTTLSLYLNIGTECGDGYRRPTVPVSSLYQMERGTTGRQSRLPTLIPVPHLERGTTGRHSRLSTLIPVPHVERGTTGRQSRLPTSIPVPHGERGRPTTGRQSQFIYFNTGTRCVVGYHRANVPVSLPKWRYRLWAGAPQADSPRLYTSMPVPLVDKGITGRQSQSLYLNAGTACGQGYHRPRVPVSFLYLNAGTACREGYHRPTVSSLYLNTGTRCVEGYHRPTVPVSSLYLNTGTLCVEGYHRPTVPVLSLYLNTGTRCVEGYHRPTVPISLPQYR